MSRQAGLRLSTAFLISAGVACTSDTTSGERSVPDAFVDASVDAAPDRSTDINDRGVASLTWAPCASGGRFECGTLVVPVSYDAPDGPKMALAVTRWPALSPANRIGVLVYGPGVGSSGVAQAQKLPSQLIPVMGEVARRFDVIGIDIRGTGSSSPRIDCLSDAARGTMLSDLENAIDDDAADALVTAVIEGCRTGTGVSGLANFDMVSTARDVDRLRELLGEDKISLLGLSYGTWLEAVYAFLFPNRVRGAVLASAMPASNNAFDRIAVQIRGGEGALTRFFAWCDGTLDCAFRPATGTTRGAFDALASAIIATPVHAAAGTLDRATLRHTVFRVLYREQYAELALALHAAEHGDPTAMLKAAALAAPDESMEWHFVHRADDETLAPGATIDDWRARLATLRAEAPSYGALASDRDIFIRGRLLWTDSAREPFSVAAIPGAPRLLLLAGQSDPVTPLEGALSLRDAFGNGSVLVQTQTVGHFTLEDVCGLEHAARYLIDPSTLNSSPDLVECPEIPRDESVVGTLSGVLAWDPNASRVAETPIGDLIADAMREATGADVAVINGGGIRAGLPASAVLPADKNLRRPNAGYAAGPPFDIVVEDLRVVLPFGNRVVAQNVTGAELHRFLEHAVARYAGTKNGTPPFVQVSGIRMSFDSKAPAGSRIRKLSAIDGAPIADDASATYRLALPDWIWYGGVETYLFVERATAPPATGDRLEDIVAKYFLAHRDISPAIDGRIEAL